MVAFANEIEITDEEEANLKIPAHHRNNWSALSSQIYDARRMNSIPVGDDLRGQSPVRSRQPWWILALNYISSYFCPST